MALNPRQPAPALEVKIVDGGTWSLRDSKPKSFTMIVVYRGLHCPICKTYLGDLEVKLPQFEKGGVDVIALSADSQDRAAKAKAEWGLNSLRIGYGLPTSVAREWDLFISRAVRDGEPTEFTEPGLFLVKPDATLFTASIANTPWARPPLDHMLRAVGYFNERSPLARGEA
ncbi:MAG: redoxin domain-containing protein [Proteobacteria bacterium]|nr:redoxin domain-containing protein [Pseudomonadota bacterium]